MNRNRRVPARVPRARASLHKTVVTKRLNMQLYKSNYVHPSTNTKYGAVKAGDLAKYDFLVADDTAAFGSVVFKTAMALANETEDKYEACVYFASMMVAVEPNLKQVFLDVLAELSVEVVEVHIPSQAEECAVPLRGVGSRITYPELLVMQACCILLMFKNITTAGYEAFFSARIKALKGALGVVEYIGLLFPLHRAEELRSMLGSKIRLKRKLIEYVITIAREDEDILGVMGKHVEGLIENTEMQAFSFMFETLIVTSSPILMDVRVANEIINLNRAYKEITSVPYPYFYRYLGSGNPQAVLSRSNFPTLFAVARTIKEKLTENVTVQKFITTLSKSSKLVDDLLAIHIQAWQEGRLEPVTNAAAEMTATIDPELPAEEFDPSNQGVENVTNTDGGTVGQE